MAEHKNRTWWTWALTALGHASGVMVLLSINALLFVDANVIAALDFALRDLQFLEKVSLPMLLQVGIACCIWALIVITFKWGRLTLQERKSSETVVLKRATGTIMTETLIILPIFLLFTSGLAQLSINSSAGVLMAVATFQASRTSWLWEPETRLGNPRNGMAGNKEGVEERARIAAATVLTPVVPAEFRGSCNFTDLFDQRLRAISTAGSFAGVAGANVVRGLTTGQRASDYENFFYNTAFDSSPFAVRGAKKFYLAYCLTSSTYTLNGDNIVTTVNYDHNNVFPWFAYVFGRQKLSAGNLAYYSEFRSTATLPVQIDVNPRENLSISATFDDLIGSLGIP